MSGEEFRAIGHELVDRIAGFYDSLPERRITPGESPRIVRDLLGRNGIPAGGTPAGELLDEVSELLFDHSLHNGHPKFLGYITSSGAPIGALADLLAAAVNPNLGKWDLSPVATEIEAQTIRWIAEMIGYPVDGGGGMVSGGNMANFLGFMAARKARADWDIRTDGLYAEPRRLTAYASQETHTWIQKAADISGLGVDAVRWVETDHLQRMNLDALQGHIEEDRSNGCRPFIVVGTAGSVSTGAVDALPEIAAICEQNNLWFHVDGAYGAPAAALPEAPAALKALALADSLALDPHKWMYCPKEAACTLVKNAQTLPDAFSFSPVYYNLDSHDSSDDEPGINYFEHGMQNTRGFRALKVWLSLRHVGRNGQVQMIRDDIALAKQLFRLCDEHPELEACTQNLSITTFRYVPEHLATGTEQAEQALNELNRQLMIRLQTGGEAYVSNAVIDGKYVLRACIVNFRTSAEDIEALPGIIVRTGQLI